ncbi:MAG: beta-propeller fold lactonase family protein [Bacteroidia bacterium]
MGRNHFSIFIFLFFISLIFIINSCTYHKPDVIQDQIGESCYPDAIGNIFITRCAMPGCHNTASKDASGGLDLSSWDKLFEGARAGAAIVPYRSDQSFLVNFINTYSDLGQQQLPTMPYVAGNPNNSAPLSHEDVVLIKNWIDQGAPDCNGVVPFSGDPNRKKFYVTNQGCDLVAVFDAEKKVIMRYIDVGSSPQPEKPHMVRISPDGQYWYVSFIANAQKFQKYKTSDDSFAGEVDITSGSWNTFVFSPDSKTAYIVDFSTSGRVAVVDCETMTLKDLNPYPNPFPSGVTSPHGSAISPDGSSLYITKQLENGLYKFNLNDFPDGQDVSLTGTSTSEPHEITFSPDGSMYFVTCQLTDDVKVFSYQPYPLPDIFLKSIPVADFPQEMSFSLTTPYLFVSCTNGNAVSIINYQDTSLVKTVTGFYSPHGIAVDDANGVCYVVNINTDGPPPHHSSDCNGKNGFLNAISLSILDIVPNFKPELSVFPYSIAVRK